MRLQTGSRSSIRGSVVLAAIGMLASISWAHAETYSVKPLKSLGGTASHAAAINNVGQIVGTARTAAGLNHAFLYANGSITDLGTLPGGTNSAAEGINLSGQVVGSSEVAADGALHATRWYGLTASDIGLNAGRFSMAHAINDAGVVVGSVSSVDTFPIAGRWDGGSLTTLGLPGLFSSAKGVNRSGQVVGQQGTPEPFGYLWNDTSVTQLLTTGSDGSTDANGINSAGQIVGSSQVLNADAGIHAMLWSASPVPGIPTDLGTLGGLHSNAMGINATEQIVGYADTAGQVQHAAVWSSGQVVDLNTALSASEARYVTLTVATAINDQGWIVADGVDSRTAGMIRAYLLTPAAASCRRDHGHKGSESGDHGGKQQAKPEAERGMTRDEAQLSAWGAPLSINVATNGSLRSELWWYHDDRHLLFTNGCLKSVHR